MSILQVGGVQIDRDQKTVTRDGTVIALSAKEYSMLEFMASNAGAVVTRAQINEHVWGNVNPQSNVVDVYVGYLRNKLDKPFPTALIKSVRGQGYIFAQSPTA